MLLGGYDVHWENGGAYFDNLRDNFSLLVWLCE